MFENKLNILYPFSLAWGNICLSAKMLPAGVGGCKIKDGKSPRLVQPGNFVWTKDRPDLWNVSTLEKNKVGFIMEQSSGSGGGKGPDNWRNWWGQTELFCFVSSMGWLPII